MDTTFFSICFIFVRYVLALVIGNITSIKTAKVTTSLQMDTNYLKMFNTRVITLMDELNLVDVIFFCMFSIMIISPVYVLYSNCKHRSKSVQFAIIYTFIYSLYTVNGQYRITSFTSYLYVLYNFFKLIAQPHH